MMEKLDPAAEWLRLSAHYRQMSDNELLQLARNYGKLTEAAQQTLAGEISARRLKMQTEESPPAPSPAAESDFSSWYDEDRELVEICTVWSMGDALQVQELLDRAGIPFYMGPEKATGVDAVTSSFANGVSVKIMQIGIPWAREAMKHYEPANEPPQMQEEELKELTVRCPKCGSSEVVFEHLIRGSTIAAEDSPRKFAWTCDSCGQQWQDEGIVKE